MSRQNYTHIQVKEEEILALREAGATRQEIANQLGLSKVANQLGLSKVQIKNWINRYNRKQTKLEAGIFPKPKGRRRKVAEPGDPGDIIAEQAREIRRLKMENELLRDFLRSTGRK